MATEEEGTEPNNDNPAEEEGTEPRSDNDNPKDDDDDSDDDDSESEHEEELDSDSESDYPPGYDTDSEILNAETDSDEELSEKVKQILGEDEEGSLSDPKFRAKVEKVIDEAFEEVDKEVDQKETRMLNIPNRDREDAYNFPKDKEDWQEEDLREVWTDAPVLTQKTGWDPTMWGDKKELSYVLDEIKDGTDFPLAPFYVPYRKYYPVIPRYTPPGGRGPGYEYCKDLCTPKDIIEELDMIEEFLKWVSYVFPDGSSYEGTVWDDVAQGKGVYVAEQGLVRYEGEWFRNEMEGHGVIEVDIPDIEPIPGSKLEKEMRAEGKIIKRDYTHPEDKEWLEMDIEDSVELAGGRYETPFYEKDEWVKIFGAKPEAGTYKYSGQWKHSRMHGCGVYEFNDKIVFGRFYFGELVDDPAGCDEDISTMHAGIAEVAAAKARMFVNKPNGMVREQRGPYMDPQHPYFYEKADFWQAPGFVSEYYDVPDVWKTYAQEVDKEREMWLNSFYKAPLRLAMPAELEHWWEKDPDDPEFVLVNKEPEPDPEDPTKLVYTEDPLILHTKTGRLINYVEDEEHGIRLFWQPPASSEKDIDASKVEFLPLGFEDLEEGYDEKMEEEQKVKDYKRFDKRVTRWVNNWVERKKKECADKMLLFEKEMELADLEMELEEALEEMEEDFEEEYKKEQELLEKKAQEAKEEEVKEEKEEKEEVSVPSPPVKEKEDEPPKKETEPKEEPIKVQKKKEESSESESEESESDSDEEDDVAPSSFGSVDKGNGKSPFSTLSLATSSLMSAVPFSFLSKRNGLPSSPLKAAVPHPSISSSDGSSVPTPSLSFKSAHFPREKVRLRAAAKHSGIGMIRDYRCQRRRRLHKSAAATNNSSSHDPRGSSRYLNWLHGSPENQTDYVLSLHSAVDCLDPGVANVSTCIDL